MLINKNERGNIKMGYTISGKEYPLKEIFNSTFEYHIPAYQRPYAWTKENTSVLFDDLYDFFHNEPDDSYFLGNIVLIKKEHESKADVVDGQQRLTTLSILFAVLANRIYELGGDESLVKACKSYLQEEGKILENIPAHPRLFLRAKEQEFFKKYIQNVDLQSLSEIDSTKLDTEAKQHIKENCQVLRECFQNNFDTIDKLIAFSQFLLNRCFLIAVLTENQNSAFRIFSVMNSRGLDLLPTDIIKSETIGKFPIDEQQAYTNKWEDMENLVGRDGFNEVFTHTRTIFAKERPRKNLLDEFRELILEKISPKVLIDNYLQPYTEIYDKLRNCSFSAPKYAEEINNLLGWLNKTNNYDWMPSAIKFFSEHLNNTEYILWFLQKLERLASYLLVTEQNVNRRIERYRWILVEMEDFPNNSLEHPLRNIELTEWEKKQFYQKLDSNIYGMTSQRRNYIVQRLDSFVSDGGASYNSKIFTIEHVLPQHPKINSQWLQLWPDEAIRDKWLNRIANLVPLTRQRNSAAQNYDFDVKKEKYFQSAKGTSSFALTTQVLNMHSWNPSVVENRQKELMSIFQKNWRLEENAENVTTNNEFLLASRGASATGYPTENDTFVVRKGSRISADKTEGLQTGYVTLRENLHQNGIIQNSIFQQDYKFDSPSAASAVILGRSSNGRKEWKRLDGQTLAQTGH